MPACPLLAFWDPLAAARHDSVSSLKPELQESLNTMVLPQFFWCCQSKQCLLMIGIGFRTLLAKPVCEIGVWTRMPFGFKAWQNISHYSKSTWRLFFMKKMCTLAMQGFWDILVSDRGYFFFFKVCIFQRLPTMNRFPIVLEMVLTYDNKDALPHRVYNLRSIPNCIVLAVYNFVF